MEYTINRARTALHTSLVFTVKIKGWLYVEAYWGIQINWTTESHLYKNYAPCSLLPSRCRSSYLFSCDKILNHIFCMLHRIVLTHCCSSNSWKSAGSTSTSNAPLQRTSTEPYKSSLVYLSELTLRLLNIFLENYWWIHLSSIRATVSQPPMLSPCRIHFRSVLPCLLLMRVAP